MKPADFRQLSLPSRTLVWEKNQPKPHNPMQPTGKLKVFGLNSDIPRFPAGAGDHFSTLCLWFPSPPFLAKEALDFIWITIPCWRLNRPAYRRHHRLKSGFPNGAIRMSQPCTWAMVTACNDDIQEHLHQAFHHLVPNNVSFLSFCPILTPYGE